MTFTNNATAEMKSRIVETLQQFAFLPKEQWGGSEKAICDMVMKALPDLTAQQLQQRSEKLLAEILYDYPNFSISTIDAFFQRIVRAFAFELGISMSYEVEVTLDDCFQQTIDLLLNRISTLAELKPIQLETHLPVVEYDTGRVNVSFDEKGEAQYDIVENVAWDYIPCNGLAFIASHTRAVCFGTLAQRSTKSRETIRHFLQAVPAD